ncbi:MAG: hypothetical protein NT111_02645 [Patescibacteria group bacterium]|nr:hypothetical protein [Patescibacteria group bacterium]
MNKLIKRIILGILSITILAAAFISFLYIESLPTSISNAEDVINTYLPSPQNVRSYQGGSSLLFQEGCLDIKGRSITDKGSTESVYSTIIDQLRKDGWQVTNEATPNGGQRANISKQYINIFQPDIYGMLEAPDDSTSAEYIELSIVLNSERCSN